mgnify:CR=1 FL=1
MSSVSSDIDISVTYGAIFPFISDPTIEEIWINTPERIFVARNGRSELTNLLLTADEVRNIVERALMWSGRRLDLSQPFVDARLPDGSRLHVAIPEITAEHWAINIRKHLMRNLELTDLAKLGVMTPEIAEYLQVEVESGSNILVSGGTQAGKTTMLNALVSAIPTNERVITVEEVFELKPVLPDLIAMQTRGVNIQGEGDIPLRRLIKESLRMRPSRIIVGEVREAEALDLVEIGAGRVGRHIKDGGAGDGVIRIVGGAVIGEVLGADLDLERKSLAIFSHTTLTGRNDFTTLGLFFCSVRDNDTAGRFFFFGHSAHQNAIMQRTNVQVCCSHKNLPNYLMGTSARKNRPHKCK